VQRTRAVGSKQLSRAVDIVEHRLDHPVMQRRGERAAARGRHRLLQREAVEDAALDAPHAAQAADVRDVRGLARPRGDGSRPRHHQQGLRFSRARRGARGALAAIVEQLLEQPALVGVRFALEIDKMHELRLQGADGGFQRLKARE
jgi:hypothetical protein